MGSTSDKLMELEMELDKKRSNSDSIIADQMAMLSKVSKDQQKRLDEAIKLAQQQGMMMQGSLGNTSSPFNAIRPTNEFLQEKTEVQIKGKIDFYLNKIKELRAQLEEKQKKYKKRKLKGLHEPKK